MTAWIIAPWDRILVAGFLILGVVMLYQGVRNFRLGLLYRQDISRTDLIEREIQGGFLVAEVHQAEVHLGL